MRDTSASRRPIHGLAVLGLLLMLAGIAVAVFVEDWKWIVYGVLVFLALGIVGALLQERARR